MNTPSSDKMSEEFVCLHFCLGCLCLTWEFKIVLTRTWLQWPSVFFFLFKEDVFGSKAVHNHWTRYLGWPCCESQAVSQIYALGSLPLLSGIFSKGFHRVFFSSKLDYSAFLLKNKRNQTMYQKNTFSSISQLKQGALSLNWLKCSPTFDCAVAFWQSLSWWKSAFECRPTSPSWMQLTSGRSFSLQTMAKHQFSVWFWLLWSHISAGQTEHLGRPQMSAIFSSQGVTISRMKPVPLGEEIWTDWNRVSVIWRDWNRVSVICMD